MDLEFKPAKEPPFEIFGVLVVRDSALYRDSLQAPYVRPHLIDGDAFLHLPEEEPKIVLRNEFGDASEPGHGLERIELILGEDFMAANVAGDRVHVSEALQKKLDEHGLDIEPVMASIVGREVCNLSFGPIWPHSTGPDIATSLNLLENFKAVGFSDGLNGWEMAEEQCGVSYDDVIAAIGPIDLDEYEGIEIVEYGFVNWDGSVVAYKSLGEDGWCAFKLMSWMESIIEAACIRETGDKSGYEERFEAFKRDFDARVQTRANDRHPAKPR